MVDFGADSNDKLAYFQAVTGLEDRDLCAEILAAHGWDLELAVSAITSTSSSAGVSGAAGSSGPPNSGERRDVDASGREPGDMPVAQSPGVAWKLITLPFTVISGSLGLISGAVGLGFWVAGGVLNYSMSMLGRRSPSGGAAGDDSSPLTSISAVASEALDFVAAFEREYGSSHPGFVTEGFMDALQRSRQSFKLLFVYLHSPDHPDTPAFCGGSLCSDPVVAFINENLVSWGGSIRASEGFKMSNSLKASRFPFCAVVMAASNQRIALLQQIEGPRSPEQMLTILQKVVEDSAPVLVAARLEAEERQSNMRLREEQDAAYRAALEADQARERQRKEEQERLEREAVEAERKRKEEEEAQERAVREAAEKEATLARRRQEKAMSLGVEPDKGPNVTQVLVRFPTGERKERRFHSTVTVQSLYEFVDSLDCLKAEKYSLVSNFPRVVYGPEKLPLSLKDAGLHPQASLFVEVDL
ncbi:plant UBX domain-containing protein 10-like [Aristolochia californica]|uniref:plant UBX domain-containing protein 10-like n=1 Tax=Aristolochia californica TaxID=171875 RepID=UPI0035D9E6F5